MAMFASSKPRVKVSIISSNAETVNAATAALCRSFLELSGLKVMKAWAEYHETP